MVIFRALGRLGTTLGPIVFSLLLYSHTSVNLSSPRKLRSVTSSITLSSRSSTVRVLRSVNTSPATE